MRKTVALVLLVIIAFAFLSSLKELPFGVSRARVGRHYINKGVEETGAVNIVTSVVLNYRCLDTLGEITVLFIAALGLGAILATVEKKAKREVTPSSLILSTGCKLLSPFVLLFGVYIFLNGHLTPGGGFQGGAIIASGYLLMYLGCPGRGINKRRFKVIESLGGLVFVVIGLLGLCLGGYFLFNFLPKGTPNTLLSGGIIPVIYIAIGLKVGAELAGIINALIEESE